MKLHLALTLAAGLALAGGACAPAGAGPTTLRYGLTLAPTGIDPHINASAELGIPLTSVYDTLVYLDPVSGAFAPGLAERWTISDDGLVYTFTLRTDVRFHDGTSFDAEAVRANVEYVLNPEHHSQKAAAMLGPLDRVEVIDAHTVALHLHEPFAPLLDSLSQVYLGMASPQALATWGPSEYQFHQVGTGPYRFVEYIANDRLTIERNPDYAWAPSVYRSSTAQIDRIVFTFYADAATRALALEAGEVDVLGEVPPRDAERLAATGRFTLHAVPIPSQPLQYFFNTQRPPTDDVRVRQALILAVDRAAIVRMVFGAHSPAARGPLSAATLGFAPQAAFPEPDPARAAALLEQAGWVDDDGDGVRTRSGQPLAVRLVVPPWGSNPEAAQLVQEAWRAVGARVELELVAGFGPLREAQAAGGYNAISLNFFGSDPDLLRAFYASDGLYNWANLDDPLIDALLDQAAAETHDADARLAHYARFAEQVRDQALILPIRDYVSLVVVRAGVEGLTFSAQGWFPNLIDVRLAP